MGSTMVVELAPRTRVSRTGELRENAKYCLCKELKKLNLTRSCTSRVTTDYETLKAMRDAGCRLMIVGYESGDQQILENIKKGAPFDMARRFTKDAHSPGLTIHGDFVVGLPCESRESIRKTIDFAKELNTEPIQV
jgi:radical SAM superfamily enzyme YgiQ (UPF0313 family)